MGLSTNTAFIKIRDEVLLQGISLAAIKMPSFDPRDLGLTFTDTERQVLKRFWGNHWQLGMKSHLVKAWIANQQDALDKGEIKEAFQALFDSLALQGVSKKTAITLLRKRLDREDD